MIVLFGPPLAGKRTLLERVFGGVRSESRLRHPSGHLALRVEPGDGRAPVFTFPGSVWDASAWDEPLREATAIGLVLDAQPSRQEANRACVQQLLASALAPTLPGCVIWTKCDLASPPFPSPELPLEEPTFAGWPTFFVRGDRALEPGTALAWLESVRTT